MLSFASVYCKFSCNFFDGLSSWFIFYGLLRLNIFASWFGLLDFMHMYANLHRLSKLRLKTYTGIFVMELLFDNHLSELIWWYVKIKELNMLLNMRFYSNVQFYPAGT